MSERTAAYPSGNAPPAINSGCAGIIDIIWLVVGHCISLHDVAEKHKGWEGVCEFCGGKRQCRSDSRMKIVRKMQTAATREERLTSWGIAEPMTKAIDQ